MEILLKKYLRTERNEVIIDCQAMGGDETLEQWNEFVER